MEVLSNSNEHETSYSNINPFFGNYAIETQKIIFDSFFNNIYGKTVLEFGFGQGDLLIHMAQLGAKAHGLELVKNAKELLLKKQKIKKLETEIPVRLGEFTKLPYETNFFDIVVSFHTIEHIKDEAQIMSELARVLKADGKLLIGVPRVDEGNENNKSAFHTRFHFREYSKSSLVKAVENSGLNVLKLMEYDKKLNQSVQHIIHKHMPNLIRKTNKNEKLNKEKQHTNPDFTDSKLAKIHRIAVAALSKIGYIDRLIIGKGDSLVCLAQKRTN